MIILPEEGFQFTGMVHSDDQPQDGLAAWLLGGLLDVEHDLEGKPFHIWQP